MGMRATSLADPEPASERLARLKQAGSYGRPTSIQRGSTRGQPIVVLIDAADFDWLIELAAQALHTL